MSVSRCTAVDLFAGAGGLSIGLLRAGFDVVGALDHWGPAVQTYRANLAHSILDADIRSLSVAEFRDVIALSPDERPDLVAGGPPCQGFSIQRIGADVDSRNELVFEFVRFVLGLQPRAFLMENVPGFVGKRGSHLVTRFEALLAEGGYEVAAVMVNAADFGVPQIRKRVLYYGWRLGEPPLAHPRQTHDPATHLTVWDAIGDLQSPPDKDNPADPLHVRSRMSDLNLKRLRLIPPGGGFEHLPVELRVNAHKNGAARIGHRNVYGRLDPTRPAGTITARFDSFTRGKFAHPYEDRNITLREGARLQTFDDSFRFLGTREEVAALIGNAIPPRLAEIVGRAIVSQLQAPSSSTVPGLAEQQLRLFPGVVAAKG